MEEKQGFQEGMTFFHYNIVIGKIRQEIGIFCCTYSDVELSQQKTKPAQYPHFFFYLMFLLLLLLDL